MNWKEYYHNKVDSGLCPKCSKPLGKYKSCCDECMKKTRAYHRKKYHDYKDQGYCPDCGRIIYLPKATYCEICRAKKTEQMKVKRENDTEFRQKEIASNNERKKKVRSYRKANHLCTKCGRQLEKDDTHSRCLMCRVKERKGGS